VDVAGIFDLPALPEITYEKYNEDYERDNSPDLGGAEGKSPISLNQIEFLKQLATTIAYSNFSAFNKWNKVWVAGILEKNHQSISQRQNYLKQLLGRPLHWETAVAVLLESFQSWLPVKTFDNMEWIWRLWVEMCSKKCAGEFWEAWKQGR
jgi:hypothetical protein